MSAAPLPPMVTTHNQRALVAGIASALQLFRESGELEALAAAVRLQRILEAAPPPEGVAELMVPRCAWCPPATTLPVTLFAQQHALRLTDGACPACAAALRADLQRAIAPAAPAPALVALA